MLEINASRPLTWFDSEPSEYISSEKLFLNVRIAFFIRAFARLMIRGSPELIRSSRPDATTLIATWRHWNSAAEITFDWATFNTSKSEYRW